MLIYTKNINDINIEDIDNLIAKKQIESKFLEFKQQKSKPFVDLQMLMEDCLYMV